jgi:hypothetical protein
MTKIAWALSILTTLACKRTRSPASHPRDSAPTEVEVAIVDAPSPTLDTAGETSDEAADASAPEAAVHANCVAGTSNGPLSYHIERFDHAHPLMRFDIPVIALPDAMATNEINATLAPWTGKAAVEHFLRFKAENLPAPHYDERYFWATATCQVNLLSERFASVFCVSWVPLELASGQGSYTWRIADGHAVAVHYDDVFDHKWRHALIEWIYKDVYKQRGFKDMKYPADIRDDSGWSEARGLDLSLGSLINDFVIDRDGIGWRICPGLLDCDGCGDQFVRLPWSTAHWYAKPDGMLADLEVAAKDPSACTSSFHGEQGLLPLKGFVFPTE